MPSSAGSVEWFGRFREQAVAGDAFELASAIDDFIRDYPLARGLRDDRRYVLNVAPLNLRRHDVRLELTRPEGSMAAMIPVGRPVGRRAALATIGWGLEGLHSGTRYYTRKFIADESTSTEIVAAIVEANRELYGTGGEDIRWALTVWPQSNGRVPARPQSQAAEDRRANMPGARTHVVRFLVGAAVATTFSLALVMSSSTANQAQTVIAHLVGSFLLGGLFYVAAARMTMAGRYLEFWEVPTWRFLQFGVHVSAAITGAVVWLFVMLFTSGRL